MVLVTTLGTSSPHPRAGDPCSSFLVEGAGARVWLDAGAGTLGALLGVCRLEDLGAVWISHTHADHFSDLAAVFYALRYADVSRPPLTVFGPPGWAERLRAFVTHTAVPSPLEDVFDIREVRDGDEHVVAGLRLMAVEMVHDAPCHGVRLTDGVAVVAYTGDTGPCPALQRLAAGADLLISEAGYGLGSSGTEGVHLTAAQAGRAAEETGAGLLLTHLAGADVEACVDAASAAGAPSVRGAHPGQVTHVR